MITIKPDSIIKVMKYTSRLLNNSMNFNKQYTACDCNLNVNTVVSQSQSFKETYSFNFSTVVIGKYPLRSTQRMSIKIKGMLFSFFDNTLKKSRN